MRAETNNWASDESRLASVSENDPIKPKGRGGRLKKSCMKILITSIGVAGRMNPRLIGGSALGRHSEVAVQTSDGLLLASDENKVCQFVRKVLQECGLAVDAVQGGEGALQAALTGCYDVIVPDIMLQGRDGLSVFRVLRAVRNSTPTLLFTARVKVSERVAGLEPGTNDYVAKPFNMRELVARINGLARDGRSRRLAFCSGDPWFENLRRALRHELSLDTMRHASSVSSIASYFRS